MWGRDRAQTHAGTAGGSRGFGPDVDAHADGEGWAVKVGRLAVGIEEARSAAVRVDMRGTPAAIYDGVVWADYCGRHRLWLSVATNTVLVALA